MGAINNIFNIKIQYVSMSCSINLGNAVNIGAQSDSKTIGGAVYIGDLGRNADFGRNIYIDPDLIDQPQVGL